MSDRVLTPERSHIAEKEAEVQPLQSTHEPSAETAITAESPLLGPANRWADLLVATYTRGEAASQETSHEYEQVRNELVEAARMRNGQADVQEEDASILEQITKTNLPTEAAQPLSLPASAEQFHLYDPSLGRVRMVAAFPDQLSQQISRQVAQRLNRFLSDHNPAHLKAITEICRFSADAEHLFAEYTQNHQAEMHKLMEQLKYLGLHKSLVAEGENSTLIQALVKSEQFGRNTSEDLGRTDQDTLKNIIHTGEHPSIEAINQATGEQNFDTLFEFIKNLTTDQDVAQLKQRYQDNPEVIALIDWTTRQAITREMLPREAVVPVRSIDMTKLRKLRSLGQDDENENFQSSNPISLWEDPETHRRFIVKQCPEQTLQSDYFGLEMLQLAGVPIYEFYSGELQGEEGRPPSRVLVTGFLEGFTDPSQLISLPEGAPQEMMKARLPDELKDSPYIKRAMLVELLIGEYNSKAHNFMVLGKSVQHLDQGACLTSTASGKFKGFSETITIQDIQDVISCYPDWDWDAEEPVNEVYAKVAEVKDGQLVIKDIPTAERLLHQLQSIPQEKINEALEQAGFQDGEISMQRLRGWIQEIDNKILPSYEPAVGSDLKKTSPSKRRDQYIRWANDAKQTFEKAIAAGGELSYYKNTLERRRASLEAIWNESITKAKESNPIKEV